MKKSLLLMLFLALTWCWTAQADQLTFDFEDGQIPSEWTNDATYPWEITTAAAYAGTNSIRSGNAGINNSTSSISATFTFAGDGTISFAARCSSEQSNPSYDWDYGTFFIDGVQQGSKIVNSASFTVYNYNVEAGTHTFMWKYKKDGSVGNNDDCLYVDDVVVDLGVAAACPKPTNLAVSNILHNEATLSWTSGATSFDICINDDESNLISATESPYSLTGLSPLTNYSVKVRTVCGGPNGNSEWTNAINFKTKAVAESVGDSWSDDFEGTSCGWELINGTLTNAWAWGEAASNGGTHALYISKDGGATYEYASGASFVYATKLLSFTDGKFIFSYDWQANGESSYDYLRAWLAPSSASFTPGALPDGTTSQYSYVNKTPTGWISLDGGSKLNLVTAWQTKEVVADVAAGSYYLVFMWCNDGSGGSQPPAAVDNVNIVKLACPYDVAGLAVDGTSITTSSATLTWTAGEATQWQIAHSKDNSFPDGQTTMAIVSEASASLSGLDASSTYFVKVRAYCGGSDFGAWSDVISFATECEAIDLSQSTNDTLWFENFDSYTAAAGFLPICWNRINNGTSYSSYPYVYGYNANSTSNCLYFYTYGSSSTTTIDDQYAILPEMDGLDGKQITLWAKGYNASSTFKIGLISDPADVTTFAEIAEQELTTSYQEFTYNIQGSGRIAIMMPKPKSSSSVYRGVYIDDILIAYPPACPKPTDFDAIPSGQTATLTWTSDASAFDIAYAKDATADPEENVAGNSNTNTYSMNGLTIDADHYFWVRANCGTDGTSEWVGPVSVHIGYCVPNPSSRDGKGITKVAFGVGDEKVNNIDETNGLPATAPFYGDYSSMTGALYAGLESTVSITYATGSSTVYSYGTIIWVDWNNSLTFEDDEIVYTGTSTQGSGGVPQVLEASFTIPANQPVGDYRMRIAGADSYFDSYIGGTATADHSACFTSSYAVCHDYTLRVLEAPSCLPPTSLAVEYNGGTEATISWTSDASSFNMKVNGTPIDAAINSPSYVLGGLELATTYSIEVQANCGTATSDWTSPVSFTTDLCLPADMCAINYSLTDQYNDSWNGASIKVKDVVTDEIIATIAMPNVTGPYIGSFTVCDGRAIQFVWSSGSYDSECRYTFTDIQGQEIFSGSGAMSAPVDYTVDCPSCFKPKELAASNIASSTADLSWTAGASETQWVLQYSEDSEFASAVSETIDDNPSFQLTGLEPEHTYYVRVKAVCGSDDESDWVVLAEPITTLAECPVPVNLAASHVLAYSADLAWVGESDSYNVTLGSDDPIILKSFDFSDGSIPSDFENDATNPWIIKENEGAYHIESNIAGMSSTTTTISLTVTYPAAGTIDFDAQCMGEGTSTAWDKCIFSIDGTAMFTKGQNGEQWDHYSFEVAAGEHTFTWSYSKDSSVDPTGDYFAVDNIVLSQTNIIWETTPRVSSVTSLALEDLTPETHYFVKVAGVCDAITTEESEAVDFITLPTQQVVITSVGLATYYNEYAYEMPYGITGYAFGSDNHFQMAYEAGDTVAALVPLILEGPAGTHELAPTLEPLQAAPADNLLIGVLEETEVADETGYKFYVLSLNADGEASSAGFYWYNADGSGDFTVPAHKAYLKLSDAQANNAPGFIFDENGATSLDNLKGVEGTLKFIQDGTIYILREGVIYDATGRKVRTLE